MDGVVGEADGFSNQNVDGGVMARRPVAFTRAELERALRAAKAAGIDVQRFEVDKAGKIVVFTAQPARDTSDKSVVEWDNI